MYLLEASDKAPIANNTQNVFPSQRVESPQLSNPDLTDGGTFEYVDSKCDCRHCLPVRSDAIIGMNGRLLAAWSPGPLEGNHPQAGAVRYHTEVDKLVV